MPVAYNSVVPDSINTMEMLDIVFVFEAPVTQEVIQMFEKVKILEGKIWWKWRVKQIIIAQFVEFL